MDISLIVFLVCACIKILFFPAYKSTDFEVHRNWLAITHSLPVSQWYYEDTSEWTLDYPPFFAWFEYGLSQVAAIIDPAIVSVNNLNYSSYSCILFQRLSVICTEVILCLAIVIHFKRQPENEENRLAKLVISLQLLCNFGLFIVDHIHFQYNGFLFGVLLMSVCLMLQGRHIESAVLFTILLNLKHIFLYIAPAYFVYLLKHYCFITPVVVKTNSKAIPRPSSLLQLSLPRLFILGGLVIFIFLLSFGPFILMGQLGQVISRLFPLKRGLCHAYWAPNFWALYNIGDKTLSVLFPRIGLADLVASNGSMTSGLVGEMTHQVLPSVSPLATVIITLVAMAIPLIKLWWYPSTPREFLKTLILCGYASFLFGWHVHEKAILMITLPLSLLALHDRLFTRIYLVLSFAGHISLFPLLFTPSETLIKVMVFIAFTALSFISMPSCIKSVQKTKPKGLLQNICFPGITLADSLLLMILLAIQVYCVGLHNLGGFMGNLPFLPLLLTSVSCAVVIIWTWVITLTDNATKHKLD